MQVETNRVVRFHYTLTAADGALIESSRGGTPMAALWGVGGLIPGVERALAGRSAGDAVEVQVPPADGYGERQPELVQRVPKKHFRDAARLKPGMVTELGTQHGPRAVTVLKVGMSVVDVDGNHPLAGQTLNFAIEVVDVREATAEEIAHGHVHGEGGVHH